MDYTPRKIEDKLEKWINRKEIILLKGPRQAGKTTLLEYLKERLDGAFITLEDETLLKSFEKSPKEFAQRFLEKKFLFIDEAQYCGKAGKSIKLIFDLFSDKIKLFVTGSGSFDIKVEVGSYLVGRAIYFELFPLDFEEFLLWKARDMYNLFVKYKKSIKDFILNGKDIEVKPVFEEEFNSLLQEYILFGGFPAIVKESDIEIKKELLKNLVRTYLEKDVAFFLNIRHLDKFRNLLNYLSINAGSITELSSITADIKIDYKTIENYLFVLSNTYIVHPIPPFHKNLATELKKAKKIYFIDSGLRNSIINNFLPIESRTDKGILLENFILNELRDFEKIKYWRTTGRAEVDFILDVEGEIIPVEVKSRTKLKRGFYSFLKTYKPKKAIVFTEKEFGIKKIEETKVAFVPYFFI